MLSRIIKIDLRTDDTTVRNAGYIGEVNHRKIEVFPPADLMDADYFALAFDIAGEVYRPPVTEAGNRVQVSLAPPVTSQELMGMTLEGYRADGTILGKSLKVTLRFLPSADGPPGDFGGSHSSFRFTFVHGDWIQVGPDEYRLTIPLEAHGMGARAYAAAHNVENGGGEMENAVFSVRRTPRGDIVLTSALQVAGEIFISKGND